MTHKLLRPRGPDHRLAGSAPPAPTLPAGQQIAATPGNPGGRRWQPPHLSPRQYLVLQAVADHRIQRYVLLGTYEPHLLDGKNVIWTLRALVVRSLVQLAPIGPPQITRRGRRTLDSPD